MYMNVVAISEARRGLPGLVRRVAESRRAIAIGRRGRAEVMLAPLGGAQTLRRPLAGLIQLSSRMTDADAADRIRKDLAASLERTASFIDRQPSKRKR